MIFRSLQSTVWWRVRQSGLHSLCKIRVALGDHQTMLFNQQRGGPRAFWTYRYPNFYEIFHVLNSLISNLVSPLGKIDCFITWPNFFSQCCIIFGWQQNIVRKPLWPGTFAHYTLHVETRAYAQYCLRGSATISEYCTAFEFNYAVTVFERNRHWTCRWKID